MRPQRGSAARAPAGGRLRRRITEEIACLVTADSRVPTSPLIAAAVRRACTAHDVDVARTARRR